MPVTLNDLPIGRSATVESVGASGALRQHFLDMGLIPQATVTMVKRAPMGDPIEVRIRSYELTLRVAEAQAITITNIREPEPIKSQTQAVEEISHPGYGEGGNFTKRKPKRRYLKEKFSPLRLRVIKTAAKPPFLISLPVPINKSAISPA